MKAMQRLIAALALLVFTQTATAAGQLGVSNAWIPLAPPGVDMLAGYLTLKNNGESEISVLAAQSDTFATVSVHQTVFENGVARMRKLERLVIAPGAEVKLTPGGVHLMLMKPRREMVAGDRIEIILLLSDGQRVPALFDVQGEQ